MPDRCKEIARADMADTLTVTDNHRMTASSDMTAPNPTGTHWRALAHWLEKAISILANLAVILGVIFALFQLHHAEQGDRRRIAIEAVNQTRTPEFLNAYRQLKEAASASPTMRADHAALVEGANYVMNVYDAIALLYASDVADRCIIKGAIESGAQEMGATATSLSYPTPLRDNFDKFLKLMSRQRCGP